MAPSQSVALVHHWLVARRGGERCLDALAQLLPDADLFTLVHDAEVCPAPEGVARVTTSLVQRVPGGTSLFRALLPVFPWLFRRFDLSGYDAVVTSDASLAKCVTVPKGVPHVCLCYSPVRYAFDLRETYLRQRVPALLRPLARALLSRVRDTDREAAARVTHFVAPSRHAAERIARAYDRDAKVVYPPVDTAFFTPGEPTDQAALVGTEPPWPADERPYLLLGQAVAYKRFDLAVAACARLDRPLIVAGGGPLFDSLARAAGPSTVFVRRPSDAAVRDLYRSAKAVIFPGEEDFGLVPVEAMACGTPVVALGVGGATETVVHGTTGLLYDGLTAADVERALMAFEELAPDLDPNAAVARAASFSLESHLRTMREVLIAAGVPVRKG